MHAHMHACVRALHMYVCVCGMFCDTEGEGRWGMDELGPTMEPDEEGGIFGLDSCS